MKSSDGEWKLLQHGRQHWLQPGFADLRYRPHYLPLSDLVDGIDVIYPLHSVQVSLMNRVHPQVSGPDQRLRSTPLANRHLGRPRRLIDDAPLPIRASPPQTVQMRYRKLGQPLISFVAKIMAGSFEVGEVDGSRTHLILIDSEVPVPLGHHFKAWYPARDSNPNLNVRSVPS